MHFILRGEEKKIKLSLDRLLSHCYSFALIAQNCFPSFPESLMSIIIGSCVGVCGLGSLFVCNAYDHKWTDRASLKGEDASFLGAVSLKTFRGCF